MTDTIEPQTPAPENAAVPVLAQVRALIDSHPDLALTIRETITEYVRDADYPGLVPVQITDDGETYAGVRCPWCGTDVENAEALAALDEGDRTTETGAEWFDHDHRRVEFDYSSHADYHGLCYVCTACDRPVSLPAGWTE
ncbi:hypothetical protein [Curtobacterium sp. MCBD17_026]|uniref:hypothetical protein n=1 Tax=Curtobacterium sp. MCBD17_026 TaxID=2175621 RepID=UPI000DAACE22|nr:hypothetical protein [Curtobacterium sp. MCBD17_026]WIB72627.1 hypothetical protein DEI85_17415 [Curtobacterium sp. MCBD17_026]